MPVTYSQHALERMYERSISMAFVQATVNTGNYVLQEHGTRLYSALYSYNILVPTTFTVPVLNAFGQQAFNQVTVPVTNDQGDQVFTTQWQPVFSVIVRNMVNTVSFTVTVVTNFSGSHVVTVWWN